MLKKVFVFTSVAAGLSLLLLFPVVHAVLLGANFLLHCLTLGLQTVLTRLPWVRPATRSLTDDEPFVSIHVPAHNEPPDVLIDTLKSLARIRWKNFEVLVIDNNTADESLWRPVEAFCEKLGPRFRFLHVENMTGFKAGAMNWARQFMNPAAGFIFVVDADYQVDRNCLRRALRHVTDDTIGLVQFPQHYRNINRSNLGLALDFRHFFASYMNMANRLGCVPSTGTLSLISLQALEATGGFCTESITEDAELGFRMNVKGYRAIYVNENIGTGLMPYDLEGLKKQRWRWAFGNAQILKSNWRRLLFGRELGWKQKLGFFAHLTAWFNFNLLPIATLLVLTPPALTDHITPMQHYLLILSGFTLMTYLALRFATMFYGLRREGHRIGAICLAFLSHLGLGWIFSLSWIKCLWDHRSPFVRTNKFIGAVVPRQLRSMTAELVLGVLLLASAVVLTLTDFVLGPIAAVVMASVRFAIVWVWHQTVQTCRFTERLLLPKVAPAPSATVLTKEDEAAVAEIQAVN
jgi:cellulose synthase/poly-beta-1,6-N-acetylglucosamine synthase-like glycosyltransferase